MRACRCGGCNVAGWWCSQDGSWNVVATHANAAAAATAEAAVARLVLLRRRNNMPPPTPSNNDRPVAARLKPPRGGAGNSSLMLRVIFSTTHERFVCSSRVRISAPWGRLGIYYSGHSP